MSNVRDNLARCLLPMLQPAQPAAMARPWPTPAPVVAAADCGSAAPPRSLKLRDVMREHIAHVLQITDWVIEGPNGAAAVLDMKPSTLRYRMRILGIRKPPEPDPTERVALLFRRARPPFRT